MICIWNKAKNPERIQCEENYREVVRTSVLRCDQAWCAEEQRDRKEPLPAKSDLGLNALIPLDLTLLFCSWAGSHGLASIVLAPDEHYLIQAPVSGYYTYRGFCLFKSNRFILSNAFLRFQGLQPWVFYGDFPLSKPPQAFKSNPSAGTGSHQSFSLWLFFLESTLKANTSANLLFVLPAGLWELTYWMLPSQTGNRLLFSSLPQWSLFCQPEELSLW